MNFHPNFFILLLVPGFTCSRAPALEHDDVRQNIFSYIPMPFRLSTLLLIVIATAFPLVLLGKGGEWGFAIWIDMGILLTAFCLYSIESTLIRSTCGFILIFFGIILPALLPAIIAAKTAARRAACINNLKQIGLALQNYHDANKHFPSANTCDQDGKPIFSWRVEILPMMEYGSLYDSLKKDEPWTSPHNANVLSQVQLSEYQCPSAHHDNNDCFTNYIAVIGPGTAWREDRTVKLSDLPDNGSHTVMAVQVVNSGVHWAEPRDLTVDEALEGLKTRKGLRISTPHPSGIPVLFADCTVRYLPAKMPLSLWKKLLAGEVTDLENIEYSIDPSAQDMIDLSANPLPKFVENLLLLIPITWLLSIILLFWRAINAAESRKRQFSIHR